MAQTQAAQSIGDRIAEIAVDEIGMTACSRTTNGKPGYFTSCHRDGENGPPEYWCSDFARWVWWKAGAINTDRLTPAAGNFDRCGPVRPDNPRVGDAVLFNYRAADHYADHVAIVVEVNADGTIVTVGGDERGPQGPVSEQQWASASCVARDGPYPGVNPSKHSGAPGYPLSGYVSPEEDDMPYTQQQIVDFVQQGVADGLLHAKLDSAGTTAAKGAEAAVQTRDALTALAQQVAELKTLVSQALTGTTGGIGTTTGTGTTGGTGTTTGTGTTGGTGTTSGTGTTGGTGTTTGTGTTGGTGP